MKRQRVSQRLLHGGQVRVPLGDCGRYIRRDIIPGFERMLGRAAVQEGQLLVELEGDYYVGFVPRGGEDDGSGHFYDRKLFYHHNPQEVSRLLRPQANDDVAKAFFDNCDGLWHWCNNQLLEIIRDFQDEELLQLYLSGRHILRVLAYTERRKGTSDVIAVTHKDKGFLTMALAESHGGLEFSQTKEGGYVPGGSTEEHAVVFPGARFEQRFEVPAHWHHVRDLGEERWSDSIIRWAVVFFSETSVPLTIPRH